MTGGLGFIGSHVARALILMDVEVHVIDGCLEGMGANDFNIHDIQDKVSVTKCLISDKDCVGPSLEGVDYIFNLASDVSHINSMTDPLADLKTNYQDQMVFLELCRQHCPEAKIVYSGTRQIYGPAKFLPMTEEHVIQPTDVNGINKFAAEWLHILYHRVHGLKTTSIRLTNTYGPGQQMKHNRQGFLPWFVRLAIEGNCIELFGGGEQTRDMNYVDDAVGALLLAGAQKKSVGQFYNIGHEQVISLKEIADILVQLCPKASYQVTPFPEMKKKFDIGSAHCKFDLIKNDLGWEPKTSPQEGLKRTVSFYQKYRTHYW